MWPWDELGIAGDADRRAVRRAYAARLKATQVDQDPAAFARLRAAYERALADTETRQRSRAAHPEQDAEPAEEPGGTAPGQAAAGSALLPTHPAPLGGPGPTASPAVPDISLTPSSPAEPLERDGPEPADAAPLAAMVPGTAPPAALPSALSAGPAAPDGCSRPPLDVLAAVETAFQLAPPAAPPALAAAEASSPPMAPSVPPGSPAQPGSFAASPLDAAPGSPAAPSPAAPDALRLGDAAPTGAGAELPGGAMPAASSGSWVLGHSESGLLEADGARQRAIMDQVSDLVASGDVAAAADALAAARDAGELSLAQAMALSDEIQHALAYDDGLSGPAVLHAASRLGWGSAGADQARLPPAQARVQDRLAAERWMAGLRRQGKAWRAWLGGHRAGAARMMLGRGWPLLSWMLPPEPHLQRLLGEYSAHQDWAERRLDPRRIGALRRMRAAPFPQVAGVLWYGLMVGPVLAALLLSGLPALGAAAFGWAWVARQLRRFSRSILLGMAAVPLGIVLAVAAGSHNPLETPPQRLARLADAGDADAAWELAGLLALGKGVPVDDAGAARRYRQALPRHPEAAAPLARSYETGSGVPQDLAEARRLYAAAAAGGSADGQAGLGAMLLRGIGGPSDPAAGLDLLRRAARGGSGLAMEAIGRAYLEGLGVGRNPTRAAAWLEAAANHLSTDAMAELGLMHLNGTGVSRSPEAAYVWLGRALHWTAPGNPAHGRALAARERAGRLIDPLQRSALDRQITGWFWDRRAAPEQ